MIKAASIFSQILGEISLVNFEKLVIKHGAKRHSKRDSSFDQPSLQFLKKPSEPRSPVAFRPFLPFP